MNESTPIIKEEINAILNNPSVFERLDKSYLKMMFRLYNYKLGLIELAKIENNEQELLMLYIEDNNYDQIISTCEVYSKKDKTLWIQAYSYFINLENYEKASPYLKTVLKNVGDIDSFSPITVLQNLRSKQVFSVEIVKDYILKMMNFKLKDMSIDKKEFEECYKNILSMTKKVNQLRSQPIEFNCEKCTICKENFATFINGSISNISKIVIFKCKHAYHPICLNIQDKVENDDDYNCPECYGKYEQINRRIQILYDSANDHNSFFMQLNNKNNKFDFIAKNLGRGSISSSL